MFCLDQRVTRLVPYGDDKGVFWFTAPMASSHNLDYFYCFHDILHIRSGVAHFITHSSQNSLLDE